MTASPRTTFWSKATKEERLAQIDAGISIGMNAKQIAMCLGARVQDDGRNEVSAFGHYHGRKFPNGGQRHHSNLGKLNALGRRRKVGKPEIEARGAFSIFEGA